MTKLTLVPKKHYCKLIGGKKFYWPLETFTEKEAQTEATFLLADWAQMRLAGALAWNGSPVHRLLLQQRLGIGPFKVSQSYMAIQSAPVAQMAIQAPTAQAVSNDSTEGIAIGPHLTYTDVVNLFLTESNGMTDRKKKDIKNRLATAGKSFNGTPIGQYNRTKFLEVAKSVNDREISDLYKRDIFQALYRLFSWADGRENLGFSAPGNLKDIFTPIKSTKTAADIWAKEDEKYWTKAEVKKALSVATGEIRAFILLGLNCAYGTSEIGALEKSHLKNNGSMIQTIRGKTARNAKPAKLQHSLWPETAAAIKGSISTDKNLVFATSKGCDVASNDYVGKLFREFCHTNKLKLPQFKMLRKTSANEVQKNSNGEMSSLHLGHSTKTVTESFYTESNWKALEAATDKVREYYSDCF